MISKEGIGEILKRHPQKYSFEKRVSIKRYKSCVKQRLDVFLKWEQKILNADDAELGEIIIPKVFTICWNALSNCFGENTVLLLTIDGLPVDPWEVKLRTQKEDYRANLAIHYHRWGMRNYAEEDGYCIVKCDKSLFQFLFKHYWFSPGAECRQQGFVFEEKYAPECFRWIRSGSWNSQRKYVELLKKALVVFDNCENGFHIRMETANKRLDLEKYATGFKNGS